MKAETSIKILNRPLWDWKIDLLRAAALLAFLLSVFAIVKGGATLAFNSLEGFTAPVLFAEAAVFTILFFSVLRGLKTPQYLLLVVAAAALASGILISFLPEYIQGLDLRGIIHRSFFSGILLLAVGVTGSCYSLYHLLGSTPRAFDISRYPVILFLTLAALLAYGLIIVHILKNGIEYLDWSLFTQSFQSQVLITEEWQNGWPVFSSENINQIGMLNHITGTLLLMGLTGLISLPIGVSVGVFVHEYAGRKLAGIVSFSSTALRSISGIILAITALDLLVSVKTGTFWFDIFRGFGNNINGIQLNGRGSFLFASCFISLLVIPIIAKATQEGLGSLPKDIQEGSLAVGASKEHTLFHIQLPWSLPNIITGLMLGCAEAAGALTIIFLIAGSGQYGVSPLNETTSLAYLIFDTRFGTILGDAPVQNMMGDYQYTAAIVLMILTLGLTVAALIMKKNLARRYKGA